jgi:peptidoglycan/LPS O-acetylase OafA/YrhL
MRVFNFNFVAIASVGLLVLLGFPLVTKPLERFFLTFGLSSQTFDQAELTAGERLYISPDEEPPAIRLRMKFKISDVDGFPNLFQTGDLNTGIRAEIYKTSVIAGYPIGSTIGGVTLTDTAEVGRWYDLELRAVRGIYISISLDGKAVLNFEETPSFKTNHIIVGAGFSDTRPFHGEIRDISTTVSAARSLAAARKMVLDLQISFIVLLALSIGLVSPFISGNADRKMLRHDSRYGPDTDGLRATKIAGGYRPHIDGLRAIAVIGVMMYHLRILPNYGSILGGFTGVDIFFVISGFLISKIIFTECDSGAFSFLNFYARRARRILPALLVVSGLTMIAGVVLLLPIEADRLSHSYVAALAFAANIYFYATSNYFGPGASQLPLLHLWSLGVEEQFYLVFPAIILLLSRFGQRIRGGALVALLLVSLCAAQYELSVDPPAAFYLLPFRAFELLMGGLVALPLIRKTSDASLAKYAGIIGLLLIAASFSALRDTMRFPGAVALIPCIGAALFIWSGECASTFPTRLLSMRPAVLIGRWSYSLYLYHWPLLFFARQRFPVHPENVETPVFLLSFLLAWLTYSLIETPTRYWFLTRPRVTLGFAGTALSVAAAAGIFVSATSGLSWRVDAKVNALMDYLNYQNFDQFRAGTCFIDWSQPFKELKSDCLGASNEPTAVIWGDSGIAQYASELYEAFAAHGMIMKQATASGCPPVLGLNFPLRPYCLEFNKLALQKIIKLRPQIVVLGAAWNGESEELDHLARTIDALHAAGLKVVVLGPGPRYNLPVPTILANRYKANRSDISSGDDMLRDWSLGIDKILSEYVARHPPAKYISIMSIVCPNGQCPLLVNGIPVHFDTSHVTEQGSKLFVSEFFGQILQ